ncbi:hypothetical protein COV16_04460, partial [Candidatus Woesearchaeota archaeon CG10_big_fil_rev_8_21_14_0_10_34_8]
MKQYFFVILVLLLFFVSGCEDEKESPQENVGNVENCGDGICDFIELNKHICPEDCIEILPPSSVDDKYSVDSDFPDLSTLDIMTPVESGVVYITMMVHIEGWNNEGISEGSFQQHVQAVEKLATLFEEHNAKATFEASPEFIEGYKNWNGTILNELYDKGFGIGIHADAGGSADRDGLTQEEFTQEIAIQKKNAEEVTGLDILHVSGICSSLDWVKAATDAGYLFTSGTVGYCAMALPENERPEEYSNCSNPSVCHGEMPLDLKDRVHPWRVSSGLNWLEDDSNGHLVVFASENVLAAIGTGDSQVFEESDIEEYI